MHIIIMFLVFNVVLLAVSQLCLCHTQLKIIKPNVIIALNSRTSPPKLPLDESFNVTEKNENITKPFLPICCPTGLYVRSGKCRNQTELLLDDPPLPPIYNDKLELSNKTGDDFQLQYNLPCNWGLYILKTIPPDSDDYYLLENGTLYLNKSFTEQSYSWLTQNEYCMANAISENGTNYSGVGICFSKEETQTEVPLFYAIGFAISTPFLAITFLVYALLRELKNIHGLTLMAYVASLFVAYVALVIVQFGSQAVIEAKTLCMTLAFIIHFSFLASFFWLNVMCFDIWWTFGGFRSMQGSVRQSERKKFKIYSIYAWGCASILTMVCLIMDLHPNIPTTLIRPQFGTSACWFMTEKAKAIYFYGPAGVTFICNIILFISTAIKIIHHKRETAVQLRGSDSRRHDDNKQWFNLYLKLFIVMGINWSMEIVSWLFKEKVPDYVWYVTDLANTLQGVIIFIIFVWKEKIKRLLLKRLGFRNGSFRSRNSTRSGYCSSTSRTGTSMAMGPLQDRINSNPEMNRLAQSSEENDGT
ncbi:G-protein coupled receptor Mth2-like [Chelonus insularis]|uniref:G-protein coupled receptor Mth2-like n=1 Tax=Chelonus insularis TaxID=460826 RepID=UPI0015896ED5|nr:G-protein coupled receptor Mth2-like [Chelonus insularis]